MSASDGGWHIGSPLVAVYTLNRRGADVRHEKVTKVGRKWVYFGSGHREDRFDCESMQIDGGQFTSPGRVYLTEEEYIEATEALKAWRDFRNRLPYQPPTGISAERIRELAAELTS